MGAGNMKVAACSCMERMRHPLTRKSELPDCCMESRVAWAMRFCWCCCCWNCCCCRMAAAWSRVASSNILFAISGGAASKGFTRLVKPTGLFSKTLHGKTPVNELSARLGMSLCMHLPGIDSV